MNTTIHYIYEIVNTVNSKRYIGYTIDPTRRWKVHRSIVNKKKHNTFAIHKAMTKHGMENFSMNVIYCSTDKDHCLKFAEPYFIKYFSSKITDNGYNLTDGGESNYGWVPSEETRKIWKLQRIGKRLSDEHKLKLLIANTGRRKSAETRAKLKENALKFGFKPIMTTEMLEKKRLNQIGKPIHSEERKQQLSIIFTENNPMHNAETKEKARKNKIGKGSGCRNGNAVFCNIFNPFGELVASGYLRSICEEHCFPFDKFLANSREETPIQRRGWIGWNIVNIGRPV